MRSCESLTTVTLPNTTMDAATVDPGNETTPPSCRVTADHHASAAGDKVTIWHLSSESTTGTAAFRDVGGGGFSGGSAAGVPRRFAPATRPARPTPGTKGGSGSFALDANGRLNWQLDPRQRPRRHSRDDGHRQGADAGFYGAAPRYSYFNGCSTGGRQGLMEAQRYPADYNGIVAGRAGDQLDEAPRRSTSGASVVMNATATPVPPCKLAAATAAAIAACDGIDGVKDGVIEDPQRCTYDPEGARRHVGRRVRRVHRRRRRRHPEALGRSAAPQTATFLWYGLPRGADLNAL